MKLKGSTDINLNHIDLENLNFDLNLSHSKFGITTKRDNKKFYNGITLESDIGPINLNVDLITDNVSLTSDFSDLKVNATANYKLNSNIKLGLKYEADKNSDRFCTCIESNVKLNPINLKLDTENILYGTNYNNENVKHIFGNTIKPSVEILNKKIALGYIYNQCEVVDEYGNKEHSLDNKISLGLDI